MAKKQAVDDVSGVFPHYKKVSVNDLKPYDKNSRVHSESQIERIAESINEFGFTNPILIDSNNNILAGHGRLDAAKKLGMTEVPAVELSHLTRAQARAYIIADNRIAEMSEWDMDILSSELEALKLDGIDLDLIGFDDEELAKMFPVETEDGDDDDSLNDPEIEGLEYRVIIDCEDEFQQAQLMSKLEEEGYKCRALIS